MEETNTILDLVFSLLNAFKWGFGISFVLFHIFLLMTWAHSTTPALTYDDDDEYAEEQRAPQASGWDTLMKTALAYSALKKMNDPDR